MTAAERGVVLLRNEGGLLPLRLTGHVTGHEGDGGVVGQRAVRATRIAVIGPAGGCGTDGEGGLPGSLCSAQRMLLGSYASVLSTRRVRVPTLVGSLRALIAARRTAEGGNAVIRFALGASADGGGGGDGDGLFTESGGRRAAQSARLALHAAVALARRSDFVVAAFGDTARTAGEWADRASSELPGGQMALLSALCATGTPLAAVIIGGRPVTFGGVGGDALLAGARSNLSSLVFTYPPGQEGGTAIVSARCGPNITDGAFSLSTLCKHIHFVPVPLTLNPDSLIHALPPAMIGSYSPWRGVARRQAGSRLAEARGAVAMAAACLREVADAQLDESPRRRR